MNSDDESSFSDCQSVIERVKESIPSYHTRAMRKEMFQRFGRLTSTVKPAIMRFVYRSLTGELDLFTVTDLDSECVNACMW